MILRTFFDRQEDLGHIFIGCVNRIDVEHMALQAAPLQREVVFPCPADHTAIGIRNGVERSDVVAGNSGKAAEESSILLTAASGISFLQQTDPADGAVQPLGEGRKVKNKSSSHIYHGVALLFGFGEVAGLDTGFLVFLLGCGLMLKTIISLRGKKPGLYGNILMLQNRTALGQEGAPGLETGKPSLMIADLGFGLRDLGQEKFLEKVWEWKDKYHDRIWERVNPSSVR